MNKTIENSRPVGGDYFKLSHNRKSKKYLKDYIDKFNHNDYYIFKSTNKQKLVSYEDLLEFKYSQYIFFKKDIYDINHIIEWLNFKGERFNRLCFYLDKPFPPFNPDKIIIKN